MTRKSALITGGGTGMGKAIAARLIEGGYDVTILGRRRHVLESAAAELANSSTGGEIRTEVADVSEATAGDAIVANHVAHFGALDALVTAAAFYTPVSFVDITPETWDGALDTTLRGTVFPAVAAARQMVSAGGGRIVLFSSTNGYHSEPATAEYSAAKAAIISLAKSMAVDLGASGVITNAIAPGWVRTPMTEEFLTNNSAEALASLNPLGRVGEPEELAEVAWFLIDQAPPFLIGATIFVDGGQTVSAPTP